MASWTRTALALLVGVPHAKQRVEHALPKCARIAAHHVHGWLVLQKQWTRAALAQAKGLSLASKKMIEITVDGLHIAMHHLRVRLSPLHAVTPVAMAVPGRPAARVPRDGSMTLSQAEPPRPMYAGQGLCAPIPRRRHWIFVSVLVLLHVVVLLPPI